MLLSKLIAGNRLRVSRRPAVAGWIALLTTLVLAAPTRAQDTLPLDSVKAIKKATALVKVPVGNKVAIGSGWLLKADKETGYLVTNYHVITDAPKGKNYPEAKVVFNSGADGERELRAEVVAIAPTTDLALLRVTGVKDPPTPIPLSTVKQPAETTPIVVFGFPYTGLDKGVNPPVTITKGSVSSVRKDSIVQLDTNLNPGNSGGPVVNTRGELVGVAFARPKDNDTTGIGFAVPAAEIAKLTAPHILDSGVTPKGANEGNGEVEVWVKLNDPYETVKTVTVHFAATDKLPPDGDVAKVKDAMSVELKVIDQTASGKFTVSTPKTGVVSYYCQAATEGLTAARPVSFHVNFRGAFKPGELVALTKSYNAELYYVTFSPDGKKLLLTKTTPGVELFDLESGWKATTITEHKKPGAFTSFSPDGKYFATGSWDDRYQTGDVTVHNAATNKMVFKVKGRGQLSNGSSMHFSHDSRTLGISSGDNGVVLYEVPSGKQLPGLEVERTDDEHFFQWPRFSPDGKHIATGSDEGLVRIWDLNTRKLIQSFKVGKADAVRSLAWSPDGNLLAASRYNLRNEGGDDLGTITLWDVTSGKVRAELIGHKAESVRVCFNSDGTLLASAGRGGATIRIWHVPSEKTVAMLQRGRGLGHGYVSDAVFSPDDRYLAVTQEGTLTVFDVQRVLKEFTTGSKEK